MNRLEALRILGLDEDATADDIKAAYKESAQILHPDRFQGNKKLQERATEQFKNLQEAYNLLSKGKGSGTRAGRRASPGAATTVEARIAGIVAARSQLVAQRDAAQDERRNAMGMAIVGGIVALVTVRRPYGVLGIVAALASTAAVWGVVQWVGAQRTINALDEHIKELRKEERRLRRQMEEEEDDDPGEDIDEAEGQEEED